MGGSKISGPSRQLGPLGTSTAARQEIEEASPGMAVSRRDRQFESPFLQRRVSCERYSDLERSFGESAAAVIREKISQAAAGWLPSVAGSGLRVYTAFLRSPVTGWTVAISVPAAVIDGPLYRTYQLALGASGRSPTKSLWIGQAASPSSWKTPFIATRMVW
jgi:hypothetical protein